MKPPLLYYRWMPLTLVLLAVPMAHEAPSQSVRSPNLRTAIGTVKPNRSVTLAAKRSGRVLEIAHDEGEPVKQGETLVIMDGAELDAEFAKARASVALAAIELDYAGRVDERLNRLFESKSVSEDALDEAGFNLAAARARLRIAKAEVELIQARLNEMRLQAPFDAVVTRKLAEIGQLTSPGGPLLVLEDHGQLKFHTRVKEQDIPHIEIGQAVYVTIGALADVQVEGSVSKIIPSGDAGHTFLVEVLLPSLPKLYPGMFGKAEFSSKRDAAVEP